MSLEDGINQLKISYGDALQRIGSNPSLDAIEVCPTGIVSLNEALGIGGIPIGRLIEVFGTDSCGKSTLIQHIISKFQQRATRKRAVVLNFEAPWPWDYVEKLGVLLDEPHLKYFEPEYLEMGLDICDIFIEQDTELGLICIDSIAATSPKAEYEGKSDNMKDTGLQSSLMAQYLRKIVGKAAKAGVTLLFTNQIRERAGEIYTPCGRATKFYASIRVEITVPEYLCEMDSKNNEVCIGHKMQFKIVKSNCAVPYRTSECNLIYGVGFKE